MRGQKDRIETFSSGLDWLTVSQINQYKSKREFLDFACYVFNGVRAEKLIKKPIRFGEYEGWQVEGVQHIIRARDGHQMLRFFGDTTDHWAAELLASGVYFKPTRADAAITAKFSEPEKRYAKKIRARIEAHDAKSKGKIFTTFDTYQRMHGDSGVTIGSRSGAQYLRIYDWALKHGIETNQDLWRFEAEMKAEAAVDFWNKYKEATDKSKLCAEVVKARLQKHGVCETGFKHLEPCKISSAQPPTDDERTKAYYVSTILPWFGKRAGGSLDDFFRDEALKFGLIDENGIFLPKKDS
jgi:hypothetical protein